MASYVTPRWNSGSGPQDFNQKSFSGMIMRRYPQGTAPIFALTSMQKSEKALDVEHGYFAKTFVFPQAVAAATLVGATNVVVDSTADLSKGALLANYTTGERLLVTAIVDATNITVLRGVGDVAAAAIAADEVLYKVGNAHEEGSAMPTAFAIAPIRVVNYTQIVRDAWSVTGTAAAIKQIAGDGNVAESKEDCSMQHASQIESIILTGQRYSGTQNGQPFRTAGGLTYFMRQYAPGNISTAGATTNWTQFETMVDPVFDQMTDPKNGNERYCFVGKTALKVINNLCRLNASYQVTQEQSEFGLRFSRLKLTRGDLILMEHPLLNANAVVSKMAFIVDMATFNLAYLEGRDTRADDYDGKGSPLVAGIDAQMGVLTTEFCPVVKHPEANALIKNLTAAAVG